MGGNTSNPYTVFTNDDILSWYNSANEAQSFIDNLENRKNEINNLTGEPNELINLIKSNYNDGKNEKENLDKLSNLQDEMSKMGIMEKKKNLDDLWEEEKNMGITSNPYTIFTNDDILSWYNSVNDSINERRKSYENELERQRLNEEKRKEFA